MFISFRKFNTFVGFTIEKMSFIFVHLKNFFLFRENSMHSHSICSIVWFVLQLMQKGFSSPHKMNLWVKAVCPILSLVYLTLSFRLRFSGCLGFNFGWILCSLLFVSFDQFVSYFDLMNSFIFGL